MEEIKLKVDQEVIKNTTVTEVVFWISTLHNLVTPPTALFLEYFEESTYDRLSGAFLFVSIIAVPMCVISVPVSVISFSRLIDYKKISWSTHKNIFVIFFIGTTCAALLVLMFSFITFFTL